MRTWLLAFTRHRAIDRLRGKAGQARQALALDEVAATALPAEDPWTAVDRHLLREHLRGALARLPPAQRQAVAWAYFGGYTAAEIAARQGCRWGR